MLSLVMALALWLLLDQFLSFNDGLILFIGFILTLFGMAWLAMKSSQTDPLQRELDDEYAEIRMTTCLLYTSPSPRD